MRTKTGQRWRGGWAAAWYAAATRAARTAKTAPAAMAVLAIAACGGGGGGGSEPPADPGGATSYAVTITRSGSGSGAVSSVPAGVDCGTTCSASFAAGTSVMLSAVAAAGSRFVGWGGACSGIAASTTIAASSAAACTATFSLAPVAQHALTVNRQGTGAGAVSSAPAGIDCGTACAAPFEEGAVVTLSASAATGSVFSEWGGDCAGTSASVTVTMSAARNCVARFELPYAPALSWEDYHLVGAAGPVSGTVEKIEFANGVTADAAGLPLVAVNNTTGAATVLAPGGTWKPFITVAGSELRMGSGFESAFDPASGDITDYRVRYTVFARNGRLYKVDHVSTVGPPVPQPFGNVTTRQICDSGAFTFDPPGQLASIGALWIFSAADGAGGCQYKALRFSAGASDDPIALPGVPALAVHDRARRVTGYVIDPTAGGRHQLVDADFGNPVTLGRISLLEPLADMPIALLGEAEPRHLLTFDLGSKTIYAYDLRNVAAPPVRVYTGSAVNEATLQGWSSSEIGATYVRLSVGDAGTRLIRIAADLSVTVLGTVPGTTSIAGPFTRPLLTDGHVVVLSTAAGRPVVHALPKTGGTATALSLPGDTTITGLATSGGTVWYSAFNPASGKSMVAVSADGAARETFLNRQWLAQELVPSLSASTLLPRACKRECSPAAMVIADGPDSAIPSGGAGKALRVLDATTRAPIATLGTMPLTPILAGPVLTGIPLQLGQKGLVHFHWPSLASRLFMFSSVEAGLPEIRLD